MISGLGLSVGAGVDKKEMSAVKATKDMVKSSISPYLGATGISTPTLSSTPALGFGNRGISVLGNIGSSISNINSSSNNINNNSSNINSSSNLVNSGEWKRGTTVATPHPLETSLVSKKGTPVVGKQQVPLFTNAR